MDLVGAQLWIYLVLMFGSCRRWRWRRRPPGLLSPHGGMVAKWDCLRLENEDCADWIRLRAVVLA